MPQPFNPAFLATERPPVMEARRWITDRSFPSDRPLINLSQAAPVEVPPLELREALAKLVIQEPQAHLYGPVLGMPALRAEIATQFSTAYSGPIGTENVAITQGCNQAFAAVIATLAGPDDEIILPMPWYFNHKMWLDMQGIKTLGLECGPDLIPSASAAAKLITPRTKAIVLVTPNNPTGVEYPAQVLSEFRDLARDKGLALIIDETYRDFDSRHSPASGGPAHELFSDPNWDDTVIQLYSFSKSYRLTGHRVGAIVASQARQTEVEKFLDTVAICTNQLGQYAALWGMQNLRDWVSEQREEILARRAAIQKGFSSLEGWRLLGCGAYFAYVEHPYPLPSEALCKRLVEDASLLMLPGTMFMPQNAAAAQRQIRIAFANADLAGLQEMFRRLREFKI